MNRHRSGGVIHGSTQQMRSDEQLISAISAGDATAFDELFNRHATAIKSRLQRMLRDEAAAEDVLQDTFLRVWTRSEQYSGTGPAGAWLIRTATNLALNHLRTLRRRPAQPLDGSPDEDGTRTSRGIVDNASAGPDLLCEQSENRALLRVLIDALPDTQREVLQLMIEQGMDIAQVAQQLGIARGTVKSRLHYARAHLQRQWPDKPEGTP